MAVEGELKKMEDKGKRSMNLQNFPKARKVMLFLGDILIIAASYWIAVSVVFHKNLWIPHLDLYSGMLTVMIIIAILLFNINGLYSIARKSFAEIILSVLVSMVCLAIIMMVFSFFIREFSYSRGQLLLSIMIETVLLILWRRVMWRVEKAIYGVQKILIIGNEEECAPVYHRLIHQPQLSLMIEGICTDWEGPAWERAADKAKYVLLCPKVPMKHKSTIITYCYDHGKIPMLVPEFYEVFCRGIQLRKIDDIPIFELQSMQLTTEKRILKRLFDLFIGGITFLIALPLMIPAALAVKLGDHGPVFYKQDRVGRYGKVFPIYKFRTMRVDAEKLAGPQLASEHDPRITKAGGVLRATRIDELPQLWNVLKGDMSIVGPRPERPYFVEQYEKEISCYNYRTNVKPGITGLAQVYGKYNTTVYDKLIYDLVYIQKSNILEDMILLIQTVRIVFEKSATEGVTKENSPVDLKKYEI